MRWPTVLSLVCANLLVALQAARHDWGCYETTLIYWCEALIIGGYNILRMLVVGFGSSNLSAPRLATVWNSAPGSASSPPSWAPASLPSSSGASPWAWGCS